ncbi:MAG: (2Fe-2S)-binding protein [Deltaproteobacteria bacterium]|nr:(2Fe-2S)-binding protein [Deltaproteobacteria bacterium]
MSLVTIKINGSEVQVEQGEAILGPIRAQGIKVPTLCHMDGLEPYGACRLCMVEVGAGKRTKLVTSCNFPANEGLEIQTDTERVHRHRAMLAELLLARSPHVKVVQDIAASLGVEKARFTDTEESDCLLCGLCVRVCDEIVGASAIGYEGRGVDRVVGTPFYVNPDACIACGACTEVCPTGLIQMEEQTKERWRKELSGNERICRYSRMGVVSAKVCPHNYDCATCEVDQSIWDEFGMNAMLALAPGKRRKPEKVSHFFVVEDRFYSRGHTWAKLKGDHARVGMDDFAQRIVGQVSTVTLTAKPGDVVQSGQAALTVASNGHQANMVFPVSGKVMRVNPLLEDDPTVINDDCYQRGWLYVLEPQDSYEETRKLVDPEHADQWLLAEADDLFRTLSASGGAALSDGGELLPNFASNLDKESWDRVAKRFFSKV